jgi:hypothetical protein
MFGFYKNPYFVKPNILLNTALPLLIIIIGSEIIRGVLLAQNNKTVSVISFMICLVLEVLMFSAIPRITSFNKLMDLIGLTLFPALTSNAYYHYISKRYGAIPNIVFRIIMSLNIYFLPTAAAVPDALEACLKIIFPIFRRITALYTPQNIHYTYGVGFLNESRREKEIYPLKKIVFEGY